MERTTRDGINVMGHDWRWKKRKKVQSNWDEITAVTLAATPQSILLFVILFAGLKVVVVVAASAVWNTSLFSWANQCEQQRLQLSLKPPANHAERPVSLVGAHVFQVPGENPRKRKHTHTHTKASGQNPTQKPTARRLCQPRRHPAGGPFSIFSSHDQRSSIRNLDPGNRFKSRWRPEAVLAAAEVLLGDTMLSECVLVAR